MARVAFYLNTNKTNAEATALVNNIVATAERDLKDPATLEALKQRCQGGGFDMFVQRVKVEVNDVADVSKITATPGFLRFACGGYKDIYELIAVRKKQGRSDWYA